MMRRSMIAIAALLFGLTGVVESAGPAAAASCSGYSCHGFDPNTKGCAVSAWKESGGSEANVMNRYSAGCNANWARGALTQQGYNDGDTMIIVVTTTDSRGNLESMCYPGLSNTGALHEYCYNYNYRGTGWAYTDMVDGTNTATATVYVYDFNGALIEKDSVSM